MTHRILVGDVLEQLRTLPGESVQCVVTSPPYWALRDYGVAGQLGSEPTFDAYLAKMVEVFGEVRRVLRGDGTLWLNMGDSYASQGGARTYGSSDAHTGRGDAPGKARKPNGFKPKDLIGQPWALAFALRSAGWWLRSDIVWHKPNGLPESVTDRPAKAHEYVFLLTKSAEYFFDMEAVKEPAKATHVLATQKFKNGDQTRHHGSSTAGDVSAEGGRRNLRDVWTIPTQPFPGAHFATFPERLVEPCVKAGTSDGGACVACGAPLERVIETGPPDEAWKAACGADAAGGYAGASTKNHAAHGVQDASAVKARILAGMTSKRTAGWRRTCACDPAGPTRPCVVFDPFGGSGTTVQVARRLGREGWMIELNPEYAAMAEQRITDPEYATKLRRARRAERRAAAALAAEETF